MTWTKNDTCVECGTHFVEPHQPNCSLSDAIKFEPPTEQQIRQSIERILRRRASGECYWKEEFENKAEQSETRKEAVMWQSNADLHRSFEAIWNEAADIALGLRKE